MAAGLTNIRRRKHEEPDAPAGCREATPEPVLAASGRAASVPNARRRISSIRRRLAPHREVFAALTRPDLAGLGDAEDTVHFRSLADRLERAIDAVDSARELVLGSFDVHMTRTAQRTNDVMKILTLVTVILLPGSVIAGVMGMNFKVGFFEDPSVFWLVLGGMGVIALATLLVARVKRWI